MIIVVSGTGTGVGKTHIACALVTGLRGRGGDVVGWKPVESGVIDLREQPSDEARLGDASGGAVAPTLRLSAPLSPHLAARRDGVTIDGVAIGAQLDRLAAAHQIVVLELAGGLFSPFDDQLDNADWLAAIPELRLVVVAPDRLGVLHDVGATVRAAAQANLRVHAIALARFVEADASTGTNAAELAVVCDVRVVAQLPRADVATLAARADVAAFLAELVRKRPRSLRRP